MADRRWMIYGANGYTGRLIADEAVRRGMRPVLAGRNAEQVATLANALQLEHKIFDLLGPAYVAKALEGFDAVLHCAGPFFETYQTMVTACLQAKVHYLDITGELVVFEGCFRRDAAAKEAGIVLLPGVGFDVVPSDCLAATLAQRLPSARHLELAFGGGAGPSRGTAKTMVAGLGMGGAIRRGGKITKVPLAWRTKVIPFRDRSRHAVTIPWGDVSTAFHSTGIPDIEVYLAMAPKGVTTMRLLRYLTPILTLPPVRALALSRVNASVTGPSAVQRDAARMQLWGRVSDDQGHAAEATLETPDGYTLTARTAVECVRRLLEDGVAPGAQTPSRAFGASLISSVPGCDLRMGAPA